MIVNAKFSINFGFFDLILRVYQPQSWYVFTTIKKIRIDQDIKFHICCLSCLYVLTIVDNSGLTCTKLSHKQRKSISIWTAIQRVILAHDERVNSSP